MTAFTNQQSKGCIVTSRQSECIGGHDTEKGKQRARCPTLKINVNGESTSSGLASCTTKGLCGEINSYSSYQPPFGAMMVAATSLQCPRNEHHQPVNGFWHRILENSRAVQ